MPLFIPLNDVNVNNSNQAVKELNIHNINNKEFNTAEYTIATFIKPLGFISKE